MKKYRLLIVEDDEDLAQLTREFFEQFEFECSIESGGVNAVEIILGTQPDMVLLDLSLPDIDGMQVCQQIKGRFHGRIIILTARTDIIDQVLGLEIGADDYVSKPVEPRLLLAKARAVMRREAPSVNTTPNQAVYRFNNIELHPQRREVFKSGNLVEMSYPEYELLLLLADHVGEVVTRDQIFYHLRGVEYDGQSRQADTHIACLRAKLEDNPNFPSLIKTVRSRGYLFMG